MLKMDVRVTKDEIGVRLKGIRSNLAKLPADGVQEFKKLTPIDTGNARRKTTLQNKTTIKANYPYAERLDKGWSKQAPTGMVKPFEKWIVSQVKKIFGV